MAQFTVINATRQLKHPLYHSGKRILYPWFSVQSILIKRDGMDHISRETFSLSKDYNVDRNFHLFIHSLDLKLATSLSLRSVGLFGKYHNTFCLSPQSLHKHCFQFLLGLTMVPRENKNNAYAKFGGTNKEYYCPKWPIS